MKLEAYPTIPYARSRFKTRLPANRRYLASHYWLWEEESGVWRVGFTRFATRMMGDLVDCVFNVAPSASIEVGAAIGNVEGLKAISDIYCAIEGEFLGDNPEVELDPTLVDRDPYGKGWIYRARGKADEANLDVHGYIGVLDATIDKMLSNRHSAGE